MEQLPKIVRERLQVIPKPEVHPDPDILTAFAENVLPARERTPVLEHLSQCSDCREVVALAAPELVHEHVAAAAAVPPAKSRPAWSSRLIFGWGTLAACVAIGILLLRYQTHEKGLTQLASREAVPARVAPMSNQATALEAKKQAAPEPSASAGLTAKLEAPLPPQARLKSRDKRESTAVAASPTMAGRLDEKQGGAGAASGEAETLALRPAPAIPQQEHVTVSGAADQVAMADKPQEEAKAAAPSPSANAANQTLAAAAPPAASSQAENSNTPGPPPPPASSAQSKTSVNSIGAFSRKKDAFETAQATTLQKETLARVNANYVPTRWSISADGSTLLRSNDEGRTWKPVNVASNVVFRAVTSFGTEIWAGGKNGVLYHSTDLGQHWVRVKPFSKGVELTNDIVSVEFNDSQHGKLTTAEGKIWITSDGGVSWQVQ